MTAIKNKSISKLIMGTLVLILFSLYSFSRVLQNGSGTGYSEESGETVSKSIGSIETLIIRGAGYFLAGNACIQSFLNQVELQDLSGVDSQSMEKGVSCGLYNISLAVATYSQLIKAAEATPYNPVVIEQLKRFDYDSFQEEMGLNGIVFARVREYLGNGDITGSFKYTYQGMIELRLLLVSVYNEISAGRWPDLTVIRKLNEKCAEISLFGSYAARVFDAVK